MKKSKKEKPEMLLEEKPAKKPIKTRALKLQLDEIHKSFFTNLNKNLSVKDVILLPRMKEYAVASEELDKVANNAETLEKARALFQGKLRSYRGLLDHANFGIIALGAATLIALLMKAFLAAGFGTLAALALGYFKRKFAKDATRKQMTISVIDTVLKNN